MKCGELLQEAGDYSCNVVNDLEFMCFNKDFMGYNAFLPENESNK